jgi:DNA-nicking Smr family endonuclease
MSRAGRKSDRGGRRVTADEARLWGHATRSLDPVKAKPRVAAMPAPSEPAAAPIQARERATPSRKAGATAREPSIAAVLEAKPPRSPPPLADFDRRKARQIASGRIEVDARLDLHGSRQRDARASLRAFLLTAHAKGHKTVLVITGKGGEEPADGFGSLLGERQRGVIRRNVPHWLEEPDLRAVVLSYTQASPRHGGAGALYVQLRKSRE